MWARTSNQHRLWAIVVGASAAFLPACRAPLDDVQIILDRPPPIDYQPRINAEVARDVPPEAYDELVTRARDSIRVELNFTADITLVEEGSIATETKTKRLFRVYQDGKATD